MATGNPEKAVAELRRLYAAGRAVTDGRTWWDNGATAKAMRDLGPQVERWATTWRGWAERGQRDNGTPYYWDQWLTWAKDAASAIQLYTSVAYDVALFAPITAAAKATVQDVAEGVKEAVRVAPYVLGAVGVVVVVGGLVYLTAVYGPRARHA